jgi:pimeloyl-ACP methyl ester carboxylesterase
MVGEDSTGSRLSDAIQHCPLRSPAASETNELRAIGDLAADGLGGSVRLIRDVHGAVAGRVFGLLGLLGLPARAMHDAISTGVYATARVTTSGRLASAATSSLAPPELRRLSGSREGRVALGALNGAVGDRLAAADSDAAIEMAVRADDSDPTPRLVIFVHGLCETDEAWGPGPGSFGARLRDELGYTPLVLRYNSGLHVSENGRALARLIDSTVEAWPVPVQELALVGHSMGGLVARAACHYGEEPWTRLVRHVFCLGSPHLGAPLEQAANVGGWVLGRLPETQPFAAVVGGRSAGIKDLRYGSLSTRTGETATPTSSSPTAAARSRSSRARPTTSSARPFRVSPGARSAGWSAICSSSTRAPRARAAGAGSPSRPTTAATSVE